MTEMLDSEAIENGVAELGLALNFEQPVWGIGDG